MSLIRVVPLLFILIAGTSILPHTLTLLSENSGTTQFSSPLSSGVLMALQGLSGSSNGLATAVSGDDVQVSTNTLSQNEPSVALNPSNPQQLVVGANDQLASGATWLAIYASSDSGLTWTNGLIPNTGPLTGFAEASDPGVAFSQNGILYYSGVAFNIQRGVAVDGTIFVSKSMDHGYSFSLPAIVALGSTKFFNDKPYIGVDDSTGLYAGTVYVSWTRFSSGSTSDIMLARSIDGGASFTSIKVSSSPLNQGSVPVVGPNGELYVVWNDLSNLQIMEAKSTNGGVSFFGPIKISSYFPLPSFPQSLANSFFKVNNNPTAATDDTNRNVYVAWADYQKGYAKILSSRSIDGGATWSKPTLVNDDTTTNDHFFPWMSVSHGLLNIVFYDRRLDSGNRLIDVFYAESADGGVSFSPNLRVTDQSSDPGSLDFIGDYIGIASNGTLAHPVWTDLRNISLINPNNEDIFTEGRHVDRPPVLVPVGSQTTYAGAELHFGIKATDPDVGETLTMAMPDPLQGATFVSAPSTNGTVGGVFDWIPTASQAPGSYLANFTVSDGFLTSRTMVSITVKINNAPILTVPGPQTITAGSKLTFTVSATDPEAPPDYVTISCDNCAQLGASFDSSTNTFTWIPTSAQGPGDYSVRFTATDHLLPLLSDTKSVPVHVDKLIKPPSLAPIGALTVNDETGLTFTAVAVDPNIPVLPLTFSLGPDAPTGAAISRDGVFYWFPSEAQSGVYRFTVAVSNGFLTDSKTVTVTVVEVEQAPALTVPGPQTVEVGSLLIFSVTATNPDVDDAVVLSVSRLPSGASFDPLLGSFVWTPGPNQSPGVYTVTFKAVEPGPLGLSDTKKVSVTVTQPLSTSGQPSNLGGRWHNLLLAALAIAPIVIILAALVIRARRQNSSLREDVKSVNPP